MKAGLTTEPLYYVSHRRRHAIAKHSSPESNTVLVLSAAKESKRMAPLAASIPSPATQSPWNQGNRLRHSEPPVGPPSGKWTQSGQGRRSVGPTERWAVQNGVFSKNRRGAQVLVRIRHSLVRMRQGGVEVSGAGIFLCVAGQCHIGRTAYSRLGMTALRIPGSSILMPYRTSLAAPLPCSPSNPMD